MGNTSVWNDGEDQPISPETFREMLMPAWARLYIEVSAHYHRLHGQKGERTRLNFYSEEVMSSFVMLTGFDPRRAQYATLEQQHKCLDASRELEDALEIADEQHQLDAQDSIDFAAGWMSCRDMVRASIGSLDAAYLEVMLSRATSANNHSVESSFSEGFKDRFRLRS